MVANGGPQVEALPLFGKMFIRRLDGWGLSSVSKDAGCFLCLMKMPGLKAGQDPLVFNRAMAQKHKVVSIPGFAFGLTICKRRIINACLMERWQAASVSEGVERYVSAVKVGMGNKWLTRAVSLLDGLLSKNRFFLSMLRTVS